MYVQSDGDGGAVGGGQPIPLARRADAIGTGDPERRLRADVALGAPGDADVRRP